ncbi:MAG TPA: immunoglobulin domain-containing protein, partial [Candidatus Acidoferrum sp.]
MRAGRHNAVLAVALMLCLVGTGCAGLVSATKPSTEPASDVAPAIGAEPAGQSVTVGQTATFAVAATGTAPISYQWQKNNAAISGATTASYTTPATTSADNGATFRVAVTNPAGSVTSNAATLTVTPAPVAPTITTQPASQTVTAGQTATFSVVASGTAPLSYQWQMNGTTISGATAASYTAPATTTSESGSTFKVVVTDPAGNVTSASATLTVNAAAVAPTITTQPASQTVTAGQTATFSVVASGTAPLSYQWQTNGAAISGATAASYTTPATTTANSGTTYKVVVTNSAGSATSASAILTVNADSVAPTILTQPTSLTVTAGQTATFAVVASGTAPLSYQWQKNGTTISGATAASYTTPATTTADNGDVFQVIVSNSIGSATSNSATLTVTSSSGPTVTVNWTDVHQTIEGFGAAV